MNCVFGVQGDSLFSQEQLDAAFNGTDEVPTPPELDPDAAFAHIDIESLFTSEPFPIPAGALMQQGAISCAVSMSADAPIPRRSPSPSCRVRTG